VNSFVKQFVRIYKCIIYLKQIKMARTKELLGLIVGFAAGTFLGALFVATDKSKSEKKKKKEKEQEAAEAAV
jgi:hypothetical protein